MVSWNAYTSAISLSMKSSSRPELRRSAATSEFRLYETIRLRVLAPVFTGVPFEIVPGNVSGMQIDIRRWDLYAEQFDGSTTAGSAFPTPANNLVMLSNQFTSFGIREKWFTPQNSSAINYDRIYAGCWFQDTSRTISATNDRTINVGGTIRYTRRDRLPE